MCQCLICGCCWWNYCGVCCGGVHEAFCLCSYWLCKPEDLRLIDPLCCHVCDCDGWGYNCLWYGIICCAPKAVQEWSGLRSAGKTAADLNKQTIIINNTSPIYMHHDVNSSNASNYGGNYGGGQMNTGYGSPGAGMGMQGGQGVQMNAYGGSPGGYGNPGPNMNMNVGVNAGPQGMNAKINF